MNLRAARWWCNEWVRYCAALGCIFAVHIVQAASVPVVGDEAYYRLWSGWLQWGYYDHPPMIAWWIALGEVLLEPPVGTRFLTIVSLILTSFVLYALLREAGADTCLARRGSLAWQFGVLVVSQGFIALPDSPTVLFWTASVLFAVRAARTDRTLWWLATGVVAGLACLSKYTGLLLAPGIGLWLLVSHRDQCLRPGPYLGFVLALLVLAPNIWWNALNDWVAVLSQFGRVHADGQFAATGILHVLAGQVIRFNPVLVLMLLVGCFEMVRRRGVFANSDVSALFLVSVPLVVLMLVQSERSIVLGHWTYPVLPSLAALSALGLGRADIRRVSVFWACVIVCAWLFLFDGYRWRFGSSHVPKRVESGVSVHGWPQFALSVAEAVGVTGTHWVGTIDYGSTAVLSGLDSFAGVPVVQLIERRRYPSGHSSWSADTSHRGLALLRRERVHLSSVSLADLVQCFGSVQFHGSIDRMDHGYSVDRYDVYVVSDPVSDFLVEGCRFSGYRPFLGGAGYLRQGN